MYVNAKMDSCMANDIKTKAKNACVVFEIISSNIKMYVNAKMDSCMANDIKTKAKNACVVFEERKMQNKYNTP